MAIEPFVPSEPLGRTTEPDSPVAPEGTEIPDDDTEPGKCKCFDGGFAYGCGFRICDSSGYIKVCSPGGWVFTTKKCDPNR
jgi:hypothetical protein